MTTSARTRTTAEQRLRSAHSRLVYAAWAVPARSRYLPATDERWPAIELVAHILEYQDEALRRLAFPVPERFRRPASTCDRSRGRDLRQFHWETLLESLEIGHSELCRHLVEEPPAWFGELTYEHYSRHLADLTAWHPPARGAA